MSKKSNQFSPEVRERAVRMVREHRGEYPSLWAAIEYIAPKIGCVPQTLNEWVKRDLIKPTLAPTVSSNPGRFIAENSELNERNTGKFRVKRNSNSGLAESLSAKSLIYLG